jgi:hypothetical protein
MPITLLPIIRVLMARGRLDAAVDLLAEHGKAAKTGIGWGIGVMSHYDDGLMSGVLHRLVAERRWDLLGRYAGLLVACDGVFLGSICLSAVLAGHDDAAEALAVLPQPFLTACFLPVLSSMSPEDRPMVAALLPGLSPGRRAVGEELLGDPARADALLAMLNRSHRPWNSLMVSILRDDIESFTEALGTPVDPHTLRRAAVGGIRALKAREDDAGLVRWAAHFGDAVRQTRRESERPHLLAEIGHALCKAGQRDLGEAMLMTAFEDAHALPRDDQGWSRNNALKRVGCLAIRAGAHSVSLKVLQKWAPVISSIICGQCSATEHLWRRWGKADSSV